MRVEDQHPFEVVLDTIEEAVSDIFRPLIDRGVLVVSGAEVSDLARDVAIRFHELIPECVQITAN